MKKILILILIVGMTYPCFAQSSYSWGDKDYFCLTVKQKYDTWCFFASLQMIFGSTQCTYATIYYVNFRNVDYRIDCCDVAKGTQDYVVCTDKDILLKDIVAYMNMVRNGALPSIIGKDYYSIIPVFCLEPGKKYKDFFFISNNWTHR